jgi:polyphosphate kinase 2 (PPK2 family)
MAKTEKRVKKNTENRKSDPQPAETKMKRKDYEKELEKLQIELVKMQFWVRKTRARILVLFEGRDAAGKGGVIKRITDRKRNAG